MGAVFSLHVEAIFSVSPCAGSLSPYDVRVIFGLAAVGKIFLVDRITPSKKFKPPRYGKIIISVQ